MPTSLFRSTAFLCVLLVLVCFALGAGCTMNRYEYGSSPASSAGTPSPAASSTTNVSSFTSQDAKWTAVTTEGAVMKGSLLAESRLLALSDTSGFARDLVGSGLGFSPDSRYFVYVAETETPGFAALFVYDTTMNVVTQLTNTQLATEAERSAAWGLPDAPLVWSGSSFQYLDDGVMRTVQVGASL